MRCVTSETNKLRTEILSVGIPILTKKKHSKLRKQRDVPYIPILIAFAVTLKFILFYTVTNQLPANDRVDVPSRTELNISANVRDNLTKQLRPLASKLETLNSNLKNLNNVMDTIDNKPAKPEEIASNEEVKPEVENKVEVEDPATTTTNITTAVLPKKISVFYNTYQKKDDMVSFTVIYDQLKNLNSGLLRNIPIYYSRFGDLTNWPVAKCTNKGSRECIEIAAKEEGDEIITLQYLYDFCKQHPNDRIVYAHSKGSYTHSWNNRILSKILVKAISSEECLHKMGTNGMDCNTCSSQFSGFPSHYPGNMWVADCDYINDLIPPQEFEAKKSHAVAKMHAGTSRVQPDNPNNLLWNTNLDDGTKLKFSHSMRWMIDRRSWLGTQRYAMEHWLGSSPNLKPCDVFSHKDGIPVFSYDRVRVRVKRVFADTLTPNLQMAPGQSFQESWKSPYMLHPYFKLAGRLWEYKELYSMVPPESSWLYKYWKEAN